MGSVRKKDYKERVCKKHSMIDGNQARYSSMVNEEQTPKQKEIFYRKPYGRIGEKHSGVSQNNEKKECEYNVDS